MHACVPACKGVGACYRGDRLYDTPAVQAVVTKWTSFWIKYRDILTQVGAVLLPWFHWFLGMLQRAGFTDNIIRKSATRTNVPALFATRASSSSSMAAARDLAGLDHHSGHCHDHRRQCLTHWVARIV